MTDEYHFKAIDEVMTIARRYAEHDFEMAVEAVKILYPEHLFPDVTGRLIRQLCEFIMARYAGLSAKRRALTVEANLDELREVAKTCAGFDPTEQISRERGMLIQDARLRFEVLCKPAIVHALLECLGKGEQS